MGRDRSLCPETKAMTLRRAGSSARLQTRDAHSPLRAPPTISERQIPTAFSQLGDKNGSGVMSNAFKATVLPHSDADWPLQSLRLVPKPPRPCSRGCEQALRPCLSLSLSLSLLGPVPVCPQRGCDHTEGVAAVRVAFLTHHPGALLSYQIWRRGGGVTGRGVQNKKTPENAFP